MRGRRAKYRTAYERETELKKAINRLGFSEFELLQVLVNWYQWDYCRVSVGDACTEVRSNIK